MKKYNNNDFNIKNVGESVELYGWASKVRNLGGLIFIDLRDRSGKIQLVINPECIDYSTAEKIRNEYVLKVFGKISERQSKNPNMDTGDIEVIVSKLEILNEAETPVFELDKDDALEDTRLKYRYLDLRRDNLKNNLITRHKITMCVRKFLSDNGFIEVETPILSKSTPEGARDYLVPSRVNKGNFYALPQSPQIYKQLLMIGGMEKYFQIARCFRDEDLRADRQPEFTQIDIEQSFASEEDIWAVVEGLMGRIFKEIKGIDLDKFPRIPYDDCMDQYGSDKPDTRYEMKLQDITNIFNNTEFEIFKNIINDGGIINAIVLNNHAEDLSRKDIDKLTDLVKVYKAKALSFLKYVDGELSGSIAKVLSEEEKKEIISSLNLNNNDIVFVVADKKKIVKPALGALRIRLAHDFNLIDESKFNFLWVTDFPMFEYSEEDGRYVAAHHPFTSPRKEDMDKLLTDKEHCYSRAYDLVLNGYELLSGSVRIHDSETQAKVFKAIDLTEEEARQKFGFFLDAFKYGAPPHCGVGIGLERLIMILAGTENIRDVVAFPKTASAQDLMNEAPGIVGQDQLDVLGLEIKNKKE